MGRLTKLDPQTYEMAIRHYLPQGWTDAMIAQKLGVGASTVAQQRNRLQLAPGNKFLRHFCETYGQDAVARFQGLIDTDVTLETIGRHFGFSREYARQVHLKLYGISWTAHRQQRRARGHHAALP